MHVHGLTAERLLGAPTFEQVAGRGSICRCRWWCARPVGRFRAVGQGYDHGLADLARGYGVDIAD